MDFTIGGKSEHDGSYFDTDEYNTSYYGDGLQLPPIPELAGIDPSSSELDDIINKHTLTSITVSGVANKQASLSKSTQKAPEPVATKTPRGNSQNKTELPSKEKPVKEKSVKEKSHATATTNTAIKALEANAKQLKEDQEDAKKQDLLNKIGKYYELFPDKIQQNKKITAQCKLSVVEAELERCQRVLKSSACMDNVRKADIFLNAFVENICTHYFYVPIYGLAAEAKASQLVVEEELKELSIKYEWWFAAGPEWRYMMKFLSRIQAVLEENKKNTSETTRCYNERGTSK